MSDWNITPSLASVNTINPIRNIVDKIVRPKDHALPIIDLALGDPSVFGNLPPPQEALDAVALAVQNPKTHGYTNSVGLPAATAAVAEYMTRRDGVEYAPSNITIASGASQALLLCIQLLCNPGETLLIPKPGFSLYETICGHLGVNAQLYPLDADKSWEIDIPQLRAHIQECNAAGKPVKALLLTNPGNPTGSNYRKEHLMEVAQVCLEYHLPVIADEIYGHMVFSGQKFTPFATVAGDVPVFSVGGIAKQFLVPGWRVGWIAVADPRKLLARALPHLVSLTQVVLGATTVVQAALPSLLKNVTQEFYSNLNHTLESHAAVVVDACRDVSALSCVVPQGAMYVMLKIDFSKLKDITSDEQFTQRLLTEQNVMMLPGACFKAPGFVRIVFCAPKDKLKEAMVRITAFCAQHQA